MTREEAIRELKADYCGNRIICELHQDGLCSTEDCEIWLAIKALAEQPETCDTCKYGYFGDGMCDYCRVRYPSNYERRTDESLHSK